MKHKKHSYIRSLFPLLSSDENKDLAYLDNTATTQKSQSVIDVMTHFLTHKNATIHRGIYGLSQEATQRVDEVRKQVQEWINAEKEESIIFVKGTTEALNLISHSYGKKFVKENDEILITEMEHHANIVPWQQLCKEKKCHLKVVPVLDSGELDLDAFDSLLSEKTALVSFMHVSNVLGTINPVKEICSLIKKKSSAKIVIDGAQAVGHMSVDVQEIGCDFYCFSGHKMYGPTGIGCLYGDYNLLLEMDPYQTGGDMIEYVSFEETTFALPPARFEAGTPPIAEIIALGESINVLLDIGYEAIHDIETQLLDELTTKLSSLEGIRIIGNAKNKGAIVSFVCNDIHPHDIGTFLDNEGVAVRVGHHCAQPLMRRFDVPATARVSLSMYNLSSEIDKFINALKKCQEYFK